MFGLFLVRVEAAKKKKKNIRTHRILAAVRKRRDKKPYHFIAAISREKEESLKKSLVVDSAVRKQEGKIKF